MILLCCCAAVLFLICFDYSVNLAPRFVRVRCQPLLTKGDSRNSCVQYHLLIIRAAAVAAGLGMVPPYRLVYCGTLSLHSLARGFLCIQRVVVCLLCVRPPRRWIALPLLLWSVGTRFPPGTCGLFVATKSTPWSGGKRPSDGAETTRSTPSSTSPSLSSATSGGTFRATCERGAL